MLIVPRKRIWTQQPQGVAQVDRATDFSPDVVFSGATPTVDLAASKPFVVSSIARAISQIGPSILCGANANVVQRSGLRTAIQGKFSFVAVIKKTGNGSYFNLFGTSSTNSAYQVGNLDATGLTIGIAKGGVVSLPAVAIQNNEVSVVVGSHRIDTGEYYILVKSLKTGVISRASTINTYAPTASNGDFVINRNPSPNNFEGDVYLCAWGYGFIREDLGRNLLANPWQIFRAPDSHIFVPTGAGAGGGDSLTASSIIAAHATVGSPLLSQQHALTASSIASAPAVVASPAITQRHALSSTAASASPAVVGSPSITQRHALTATAISAGPAIVGLPTLTEIVAGVLSALPIVAAPAVVGAPAITQRHVLSAGAISAGPATFVTPTLAQQHALIAQGVTAGAAVVGAPVLSEGGAVIFTNAPNGGGYSRAGENYTRPPQTNTVRH